MGEIIWQVGQCYTSTDETAKFFGNGMNAYPPVKSYYDGKLRK